MQEEVGEWKSVIPYVPNSYHGAPEGTKAHRKKGYRIWVVNTSHSRYSVDKETNSVVIDEVEVSARKISLTQLREKLLKKHEALGIVRDLSDEYFEALSTSEVIARLQQLTVPYKIGESSTALRQRLKELSCKRHIKVWHDHSSISSHGHLLVLVSTIYDPAFFYTSVEMKELKGVEMDVPTVVGKPETYILGRSTSSTVDQLHFVATRRECLQEIGQKLHTKTGAAVWDVIRFFYGDGPVAQFEAGHKQGGTYCCTGCGADSGRFSDIAYCYRAPKPTLKERQEFVLQGKAWKRGGQYYEIYIPQYNLFLHNRCTLYIHVQWQHRKCITNVQQCN